MNKKILVFSLIGLFALGIVSAIGYYALFSATIIVVQPIEVSGTLTHSVDCEAGNTCLSEDSITIENIGDSEKVVKIVKTNGNESIEVSYVGKMSFAEKDLVTGVVLTSTEEIVYTITGDTFIATGIPTTHKLVYYPDMVGGFTENVQNILVYGEDTFLSLPMLEDIGDNYCNIMTGDDSQLANPNAEVCNGAKLWLVENDYVNALKLGTWTPSNILFETDLITYTVSSIGEVSVPVNSTITIYPAFTPDVHMTGGEYEFDFEIQ